MKNFIANFVGQMGDTFNKSFEAESFDDAIIYLNQFCSTFHLKFKNLAQIG